MVIAKTLIKNRALMGGTPSEILAFVNNQLCENNEAEMFVTVWMGILDLSTGVMTAANAGHEYPAFRKADGEFELIKDKHGFVLAGWRMWHIQIMRSG
ncbi:MAG: SpoIIE family protein phosphatase [Lachnospiraceae bacterium]